MPPLRWQNQQRAIDVALAAKQTLTYGKYHLAMLHRELFMSEEKTSYQQAERMAAMMNQLTIAASRILRSFYNFHERSEFTSNLTSNLTSES